MQKNPETWAPPLLILIAALLLQAIPGAAEALRYQVEVIGSQPWRLVTGHWVHLGWMHLLLNGAGITLLAALFSQELKPLDWIVTVTVMPLLISGGFLILNPELQWYVGLSGALHGLMLTGCLLLWPTQKRMAVVIAAVVVAKLAHEQWAGAESGTEQLINGDVVVDAHLYGAIAGTLWGACRTLWTRLQTQPELDSTGRTE